MNNIFRYCFIICLANTILVGQWKVTSGPYSDNNCSFTAIGGTLFAGITFQGVFKSSDNAINWMEMNNGLSNLNIRSLINFNNNLFVGTDSGVYVSTNEGGVWNPINSGLIISPVGIPFVPRVLCLASGNNNLYAGTNGGGVFLSTNNGSTWQSIGLSNSSIISISVIDNKIFAGLNGGSVHSSNDNGLTWTELNSGLMFVATYNIISVYQKIFVATSKGVFQSTNYGATWNSVNNGLPKQYGSLEFTGDIFSLISIDTVLFAGTNGKGVYLSLDQGSNWFPWNDGFGNDNMFVIGLIKSGNNLVAGTLNGLWVRSLSDNLTVVEIENTLHKPHSFYLEQNYPNPFNPITNIEYYLPKESTVKIMVYDVLGKEINTLVDEKKSAGNYQVQFDGSKLSSGMYFYRLQSDDFVQTKKLILLK